MHNTRRRGRAGGLTREGRRFCMRNGGTGALTWIGDTGASDLRPRERWKGIGGKKKGWGGK